MHKFLGLFLRVVYRLTLNSGHANRDERRWPLLLYRLTLARTRGGICFRRQGARGAHVIFSGLPTEGLLL